MLDHIGSVYLPNERHAQHRDVNQGLGGGRLSRGCANALMVKLLIETLLPQGSIRREKV